MRTYRIDVDLGVLPADSRLTQNVSSSWGGSFPIRLLEADLLQRRTSSIRLHLCYNDRPSQQQPLPSINNLPVEKSQVYLGLLNRFRRDGEDVVREHHEIGQLPRFDAAFDLPDVPRTQTPSCTHAPLAQP